MIVNEPRPSGSGLEPRLATNAPLRSRLVEFKHHGGCIMATEPNTQPQPPALSATPDVMSLLKALRRRWILAGVVGIVAAVAVGLTAMLVFPSRYTAFQLMQVSSNPNPLTERQNNRDQ